jgi:tripartite-type tricarboxylate transporter receptor subunit TctC
MRYLRKLAIAATIGLLSQPASGQGVGDYPARPVRVISASATGGAVDILGRLMAGALSESMKRQFVVENQSGGGDTIGYGIAARSAPDGYTLLLVSPSITYVSALHRELPFDPVKDFVPISLTAKSPYVFAVNPALPVKSVSELIALAKAKPGALDMGVSFGSFTHLAASHFIAEAKIKVTIVPYKGVAQVMFDTMAGQVHMFFATVLSTIPHVKSGKLRALGVSGTERIPALPDLPTIAESGVQGYDVTSWTGWVAPAGTPAAIIQKLNAELGRAVRSPEVARRIMEDGSTPFASTPEQFRQLIADEAPRWRKVVRDAEMRMN